MICIDGYQVPRSLFATGAARCNYLAAEIRSGQLGDPGATLEVLRAALGRVQD